MKRLTVINRSEQSLVFRHDNHVIGTCCTSAGVEGQSTILLPSTSTTIQVASLRSLELFLGAALGKEGFSSSYGTWSVARNEFTIRVPMALSATWKVVKTDAHCPWRIYRSRASRRQHKLLILPRRELATFLRDMPDSIPLSSLMLPGTHDTMALYGWPISQCQSLSTPLIVQLQSGIRVLDVRLAVKDNGLIAYHGLYPQRVSFQAILSTIHDFLSAPATCRETLVISIKQEDFTTVPSFTFSKRVQEEILNGPGGKQMWFLENRIPLLGEVRGRVVMFSRFGGDGSGWENGTEGLGIHPTAWPDSEKLGFTWECKNTLIRTHDWYDIPSFLSIPEKTSLATQILLPPPNNPPMPTLAITYFSAASFPLAFPPTVARGLGWPKLGFGVEGVNSRVGKWLIDMLSHGENAWNGDGKVVRQEEEPRLRGWVFMDFYEDPEDNAVVPLLVECNFRGRVRGEEGWPWY